MKFVLSIDGGGVHVISVLAFLLMIEAHFDKEVFNIFDCYAGTSSGSILVSLITHSELPLIYIFHNVFCYDNMKNLFKRSLFEKITGSFFRPKYSIKNKTSLINKYIKNVSISQTKKDVLITAYDIDNDIPRFFKSFTNDKTKIQTIVDASSSATTYFSPVPVSIQQNTTNNDQNQEKIVMMMDGAICSNNPTDCIYADLLNKYPKEEMRILSIGQTHYNFSKLSGTSKWGSCQWLLCGSIVDRFTAVDCPTVDYRMKSFTSFLGHSYLRIEPTEPTTIAIDSSSYDDYNELLLIGKRMFDDNIGDLEKFFNIDL